MKTYGVMFKPEMIQAYKAGLKTQTRRLKGLDVINQNPGDWEFNCIRNGYAFFVSRVPSLNMHKQVRLPYGDTSCTIWIKETFQLGHLFVSRDGDWVPSAIYYRGDTAFDIKKWRSAMLMPHKYSRFTNIQILNVRVERLWNITEEDAKAEGWDGSNPIPKYSAFNTEPARQWYFNLFDTINGKKIRSSKNPWVFVYEFPKYSKEQQ